MKKISLFAVALSVFFISCRESNENSSPESVSVSEEKVKDSAYGQTRKKYQYLIGNIPIPFEILEKLSGSGTPFNAEWLNKPESAGKYLSTYSKAANIGVYGADLTYTISHSGQRYYAGFIKSIKKLADDLGVPEAFDRETMERYESTQTGGDTLERLVYSSYEKIDQSLKSTERLELAALVVAGGWTESLYLTIRAYDSHPTAEIKAVIISQKKHLKNLTSLMKDFSSEYSEAIYKKLTELENSFSEINSKELSAQKLAEIRKKNEELRTMIITGS